MINRVTEIIDSSLSEKNSKYLIREKKKQYLLKTFHIPKNGPIAYAFIGGMWYSKSQFSLNFDDISLPYPFTSYYTLKILDKTIRGKPCRSALYVKMPVIILQVQKTCYLIQFDPYIQLNNQDVFPFIHLNETEKYYEISFYITSSYEIKQKKHAWLGRGKKSSIQLEINNHDSFIFSAFIKEYETWQEAILSVIQKTVKEKKIESGLLSPEQVFYQAKQALWRSYDHKIGTFLQLPWRETPGFTFVDSSYSLLSYEAVRLDYFSQWYEQTEDEDFKIWMDQIHHLFINSEMYTKPTKQGKGIIWYNMTTLAKNGVQGYFYMDTGYSGYPGGQATIDFHLLNYLQKHPDKKLKQLVNQSLQYIISTQNKDGSWPMAIKQEGLLKFRPERLDLLTSHGGTAESIRALLLGSKFFNDENMKSAAVKGLSFLMDATPICYNGLRDIGIMEPEAFSAVTIINAFLDAYDFTREATYLENAKTYALYTLPWIYQWETKNLPFYFNFHPISYSITPRLSPYETAWIITTYNRFNAYSNNSFWEELITCLFNHVTSWISKTGGLSEGVFPNGFSGFSRLPMEQTFATVELMKSAETMLNKPLPIKEKHHDQESLDTCFHLEIENDTLMLSKHNDTIFTFNASKAMITHLKNSMLNDNGISFSFYGSYHTQRLKRKIKKQLRGNLGKYILGSKDATYALSGVKGPKPVDEITLDLLHHHILSQKISIEAKNKAVITMDTALHTITLTFHFTNIKNTVHIDMNIMITVKVHDLPCSQLVLFPVIGAKPSNISNHSIEFNRFTLTGDCFPVIEHEKYTAINQTLSTNWTHAGILKKGFRLSFQVK